MDKEIELAKLKYQYIDKEIELIKSQADLELIKSNQSDQRSTNKNISPKSVSKVSSELRDLTCPSRDKVKS
jgi:hypothetical protein